MEDAVLESSFENITYLVRYGSDAVADRRPFRSRAGEVKADYVISVLKRLGYGVTLLSFVSSQKPGYHRLRIYKPDDMENHIYLESLNVRFLPLRILAGVWRLTVLFIYLLTHLDRNATLLVYHSPLFSVPVRLAKAIKRFRLILELEEIFYREARSTLDVCLERAERALIRSADGYLAINALVREEYCGTKPAVISYGSYAIPPRCAGRYDDGKTHLAYAGIINATHGAHKAVETMRYLDDHYRLHIYGFGADGDIAALVRRIEEMNSILSGERIFYHGSKSGAEFDACLQRCHIGLNFNITLHSGSGEYAFPSKIPSYLGHGLNVVTYRIPSVSSSVFSPFVQFYDSDTPEAVARAVTEASLGTYEAQTALLERFDSVFSEELKKLIEAVKIQ